MKVLIVGAGNQGSIVADALLCARDAGAIVTPVGFLDDQRTGTLASLPILGRLDAVDGIEHDAMVIAIGDNAARRAAFTAFASRGETIVTVRHPWSSVSPQVSIALGCMISAGAVVSIGATIREGVLLNTRSSVDHDTEVGAFAHVSAGATVGARAFIGTGALIGLGASVLSGCRVGERSVVGAGAVVVRDIPDGVVAFGNPARVRRAL